MTNTLDKTENSTSKSTQTNYSFGISALRHNILMHPKPSLSFLGETYHLNHPRHDPVWPRSSVGLPTVDLFRMSYRESKFFRGPNFKVNFRVYYLHVSQITVNFRK